jgi:hypothetical protein
LKFGISLEEQMSERLIQNIAANEGADVPPDSGQLLVTHFMAGLEVRESRRQSR